MKEEKFIDTKDEIRGASRVVENFPRDARWWVDDGGVVAKMWMTREEVEEEEERLGVSRERIHDDRPPHESPPSEIPDAPLDKPASLSANPLRLQVQPLSI